MPPPSVSCLHAVWGLGPLLLRPSAMQPVASRPQLHSRNRVSAVKISASFMARERCTPSSLPDALCVHCASQSRQHGSAQSALNARYYYSISSSISSPNPVGPLWRSECHRSRSMEISNSFIKCLDTSALPGGEKLLPVLPRRVGTVFLLIFDNLFANFETTSVGNDGDWR